jgi:hypothetical protein
MHVCSAPLTLSDWRLGALTVDTFDQRLVHLSDYCCTELPKACNYEWDLWLGASSGSSAPPPPRGSLYYQHLFCRTHFILPWTQGGPPSTSPTSVVAAAGLAASTPQGARNRHLLLRWWPLSDLPPATPRGPTIDVTKFGSDRYRTCRQHPPGSLPSTSPTPVVAAARPAASNP